MNTKSNATPPSRLLMPLMLPLALAALGAGIIHSAGWHGLASVLSVLTVRSGSTALSGAELSVGLWATVVGLGLLCCGVYCAVQEWRAAPSASSEPHGRRDTLFFSPAGRGLLLASLLWTALLPFAGWLCASVLALALACRSARASLLESLVLIVLLVGGLYLGVEVLLNTPLPHGVWPELFVVLPPHFSEVVDFCAARTFFAELRVFYA